LPISRFCGILAEIISENQRRYKKGEIFDFGNVEGQEAGERSEEEREHHEEERHMDERGGREEKGGRRREEPKDPVVDEIMEVKQISDTFVNALLNQSLNGNTSFFHLSLLLPPSSFLLPPSSFLLHLPSFYYIPSPSHLPLSLLLPLLYSLPPSAVLPIFVAPLSYSFRHRVADRRKFKIQSDEEVS
jgi:hypothetical protein